MLIPLLQFLVTAINIALSVQNVILLCSDLRYQFFFFYMLQEVKDSVFREISNAVKVN